MTHREPPCQLFWKDRGWLRRFRAAVTLHGHTVHSRESMDMVPGYLSRSRWLAGLMRSELAHFQRANGYPLDFARAFWLPPLSALAAFQVEAFSIESRLGLAPMVSLTDHDDIQAGLLLQTRGSGSAPVSVEWTVPFRSTVFHLGVHNLPRHRAPGVLAELLRYTARPDAVPLRELLELVASEADTLVVLNHPLWDQRTGAERSPALHRELLMDFLGACGPCLHALELNGIRSWSENQLVLRLAEELGYPVVSGGDRHGCEPAAAVNLTNAASFSEFVAEIRRDRISRVLWMPHYREPLKLRLLQTGWELFRTYPDDPYGRPRWTDRVFLMTEDQTARPLSHFWNGDGPSAVRLLLQLIEVLQGPYLKPALRLALTGLDHGRLRRAFPRR